MCDVEKNRDVQVSKKVVVVVRTMPDLRDTTAHLMPVRDPESSESLETAETPSPTVNERHRDLKVLRVPPSRPSRPETTLTTRFPPCRASRDRWVQGINPDDVSRTLHSVSLVVTHCLYTACVEMCGLNVCFILRHPHPNLI